MIVIKLMGGLGNQMFQYAIGRSLSLKLKKKLFLDTTFLKDKSHKENFTYRNYELSNFSIENNFLTLDDFLIKRSRINYFYSFFNCSKAYKVIIEKNFNYNKSIKSLNCNAYLIGYWQSEKYFNNIRDILLSDFKLKVPMLGNNLLITNEIINSNSISIHIRRGDYVSNQHTNEIHGLCSLDYFYKSVQYMDSKFYNPIYFIFSDDIEWVMKNFNTENIKYKFIDTNKNHHHLDLILMSYCKHNIISNSSFSWWGAWLNSNVNKIVIAPKIWFANKKMNNLISDLIPNNWISL